MAALKHMASGRFVPLPHRALLGRSEMAEIRLEDPRVSLEHAVIRWNGHYWELRDLGSRNGTRVDAFQLSERHSLEICRGMRLHFGSLAQAWECVDLSPPEIAAHCLDTGEILAGAEGALSLSGIQVLTENGQEFFLVDHSGRRRLRDRDLISLQGARWRFIIPNSAPVPGRTLSAEGLILAADVKLRFLESLDGEHISIQLIAPGVRKSLKYRSFDHALLTLARARCRDARIAGVSSNEQGWVFSDELSDQLRIDPIHLNSQIYRARRRFAQAGIFDSAETIERRSSTSMIRLAVGNVEVLDPRKPSGT